MTKLKELKESHSKEKSLNTTKSLEMKEFQLKKSLPIIMLSKLKLNTFLKKLKKLLLNMNQLKKFGKEFNIFQLKLKLFTILKEITMLLHKVDTLKPNKHMLMDIAHMFLEEAE